MSWYQFDSGKTIGQKGELGGIIIFDEENEIGARIYVEEDVYLPIPKTRVRYVLHYKVIEKGINSTNFYLSGNKHIVNELMKEIEELKIELEKILQLIPHPEKRNYQNMSQVWLACHCFSQNQQKKSYR